MTEKRIFVLGASGMLGRYVWKYLATKDYTVIPVNRDVIDASSMTEEKLRAILEVVLHVKSGDVIINCVGTIKPRVDSLGDLNAILVNSVFPRVLANVCETLGVNMIHPTTDCVYSGARGSYDETDVYDVSDVYGMSKALGEPKNCTVIRTSIIGEEVGQTRSLVEWVKSMKDSEVFGFTNHFWNGVTCLQFAKICDGIITVDGFWKGIKHLHSNVLDKKQLVETISEVYGLNIKVNPKETPLRCDRSMSTVNTENLKAFNIPTLKEQIKEMKEFSNTLYN